MSPLASRSWYLAVPAAAALLLFSASVAPWRMDAEVCARHPALEQQPREALLPPPGVPVGGEGVHPTRVAPMHEAAHRPPVERQAPATEAQIAREMAQLEEAVAQLEAWHHLNSGPASVGAHPSAFPLEHLRRHPSLHEIVGQ